MRRLLLLAIAVPIWSSPIQFNITFSYSSGGLTTVGGAPINEQWLATPAGLPVAPPTRSFSYDPDAQSDGWDLYAFSNFEVTWSGGVFEILNTFLYGAPSCADGLTGQAAFFNLLTNCPSATWQGVEDNDDGDSNFSFQEIDAGGTIAVYGEDRYGVYDYPAELSSGTFTAVDPSSAPEPGTWIAAMAGLAGLAGLRTIRRKAHGSTSR